MKYTAEIYPLVKGIFRVYFGVYFKPYFQMGKSIVGVNTGLFGRTHMAIYGPYMAIFDYVFCADSDRMNLGFGFGGSKSASGTSQMYFQPNSTYFTLISCTIWV